MTTKILVDGHCIDDIAQGSVTYVTELYKSLEDPTIEVLFCNHSEANFEKYFGGKTNIKYVPVHSSGRFRRFSELNNLVEKYKADYLHFQYTAPLQKKCKWVDTLHDILFLEMRQYFPLSYIVPRAIAFWLAAKRSDIIITGSEHSKRSIESYFNIKCDKVKSLSYGVPCLSSCSDPVDQLVDKSYFLYVSRVEPRKNHIALIRSFEKYIEKGNDCYLVLVGATSILPAEFNEISGRLGDRLVMLKGISGEQLSWLYSNCLGHIYPSRGEGFGFPVLESLSLGVPTASSMNTSLSAFESLVDFKLVPNDEDAILRSFDVLRGLPHDVVRANRTTEQFNWDLHASDFARAVLSS
jgi:glycosyltransferase involved in cell wall biosynthesis